jgi:two-component system, cell cycle sensor histidine kinase and response regulator CckA
MKVRTTKYRIMGAVMSHPKRILIVDDDERNCALLEATLESLGYEWEVAHHGADAISRLNPAIDLVLMDVKMPGMDGYEAARRMRNHPHCGAVPIIMVTVLNSKEDRLRAVAAGANDFITKPIDRTELQVRVASLLQMKEAQEACCRSEEKYRALVETSKDVIWTVDMDLRYTYVSPSAPKTLGYTTVDEIMSIAPLDSCTPESRELVLATLKEALEREAQEPGKYHSYTLGLERYRKDGSKIWIEVSTTFLRDESGRPVGIMGISRDITDRKRMEEKLQKASDELEKRVLERTADLRQLTERLSLEIDERKRVEQALREKEDMMRGILATSPIGIGLSHNRSMRWCNDAWLRVFGYENETQIVGQDAHRLYPSIEEYERVGSILYDGLENGVITATDATFMRENGSLFEGHIRAKALDPSDLSQGVISAIADITARKCAEEALRHSEEKYRLVVEKAKEAILVVQDGALRFVNPQTAEMLAYQEEELLSKSFSEFVYPDERERVIERLENRLNGKTLPCRYAFRVLDHTGNVRWAEIESAIITWEEKPALLVFMSDITERVRMESALKESEEWYRTLVEKSFDGLFVQKGCKIIFANARLYDMLGYSAGELEGLDHWVIYHTDYQGITSERAAARMRGEEVTEQYEVVLQRKDGSFLDGEVSARALTVQGEPGVQVWVRDISRRKRSEEAQRRLATAVEQAAEAIIVTDAQGTIQYVNPAFERTSGYTREEIFGRDARILESGEHDPPFYKELWDTITNGSVWMGRLINRRKDGTLIHEDTTISPVRDSHGRIVNFVAVKRDMTENIELAKQLLQAQKMEAIGTLAGGIAHDFNNLLQVTLGYSELLLADKSPDDPECADLQKIHRSAKNGAELVRHLLTFSRRVESKAVPMNLNRQIEQVEKLLRRTIPKMIDIRLDLADDLLDIDADPTQMEQVLMNLAVNARDAMLEGGTLTIKTQNVSMENEQCRIRVGPKTGDCVLLTVSDTGHGMDRGTLEHIFEPFYTTKELGRGTGLGLAVVYGIVEQHGGHISCSSESGQGTKFQISLPALTPKPESSAEKIGGTVIGGTETVLLVDDEDMVRELGARILSKNGYTVRQVSNGYEAMELVREEHDRISLVVLDLIMPQMGGIKVLRELLNEYPYLKVIVASGYSGDSSIQECFKTGARGFVSKPFRMQQLLLEVRRVLDER